MSVPFSLTDFFDGRTDARRDFADRHGYADSPITPLYEDMASRRFYRLKGAVLMDSLPDDHAYATRGHRLADYMRIAKALRARGLHAPEIYAADEQAGFLLMEDLGDEWIGEDRLSDAVDVLIQFKEGFSKNELALPDYFQSHIHAGHRRVVDWYLPCVRRQKNTDYVADEYLAIWTQIEQKLPAPVSGFIHADYRRGNILWTGQDVGILDFQGALWGPLAYDLVNLLEDARLKTPPALKQECRERYGAALGVEERKSFDDWYGVLAAQFHCRTIGQFIKLGLNGKTRYLDYIPLLQEYLREELQAPKLKPLQDWFKEKGVVFEEAVDIKSDYIRPDAV